MTKKIFLSYSHKDDEYRKDFDDHLTMLRRDGAIDSWNDRRICPGQEWENQIDENLEEADIIVLLVSPSFIASPYCYDIEAARAMEKCENNEAVIISIIVRPCDWKKCPFSRYQALPTDVKAIALWDNKDSAWLDVVDGIKDCIERFDEVSTKPPRKRIEKSASINDGFLSWLNDTEIAFTHRKVDTVTLPNIFVMPDLEVDSDNKEEVVKIVEGWKILDNPGKYLLFGEEQQGKTALLKTLFVELFKKSYLPVYVDASEIKTAKLDIVLEKSIKNQYFGLSLEDFLSSSDTVILLDNVDSISLNTKFRKIFLDNINDSFKFSICTCHESFSYVIAEIPALDKHERCEILALGNRKREEIVRKWISTGFEELITDDELYSRSDDLKTRLDTVIKKNIVPAKPVYVLMILQMFEANVQLNLELTSYGHCYQQLIYQAFDKANIQKHEVDKYLNVLTELSWWIFKNDSGLSEPKLKGFFEYYCSDYLSVDRNVVLEKLVSHSILAWKNGVLGFKYPYIYYFFAGKRIAETYSDSQETKDLVSELLSKLHREDFANILIFITHHTKDSWVLNNIQDVLNSLFDDQPPAELKKEHLDFMNEFMRKIPDLVIEQREVQKERDKHNDMLDAAERDRSLDEEYAETSEILASINKTFKGMEIAGQIIRNRHAALKRSALYDLSYSGVSTGLRFLNYFIKISDTAKDEIVKHIASQLAEQPNLTDEQIERDAENAYLHLTYGVINSVIRKIGHSIGSREAFEIYSDLELREGTPAFSLIRQSIELIFLRTINIESLSGTVEKLRNNAVCTRILKELVIQHVYMFPTNYKEKQQLSKLLGVSVQGQRLMDRKVRGKG